MGIMKGTYRRKRRAGIQALGAPEWDRRRTFGQLWMSGTVLR